ncbi:hypothetical protein MMC11_004569 [Xylographa trunciseda]|nr:hypothetical protein [Xylographa trunciseda]
MSATLLPLIGWTFLPNLVTGWIQSIYYGFSIRAGDPKPQPGSLKYVKHRRRILLIVIVSYLLYTIYEVDDQLRRQGNFYESLGVAHNAGDRAIKTGFRRLYLHHPSYTLEFFALTKIFRAARHHPDKVTAAGDQSTSGAYFVHLKLAQDTLLNPTKRFAYDRFGPDALDWQHCSSIGDYLFQALSKFGPTYLGAGIMMTILAITGYLQWGRFWRYLFSALLLLLEFYTITRPYWPPLLSNAINPAFTRLTSHPPLLPFQLLVLARKTTLSIFIALSQLAPLLQPKPSALPTSSSSGGIDLQQLNRIEQITQANELETTRLLGLDMAPFIGDEHGIDDLKTRLTGWLVQNTIRNDPEVRDAMGKVMGRRRLGAPAGARNLR